MVTVAAEEPVELWIGTHLFRWEPPDVAYTAYFGDLDGDAAATLGVEARKITASKPRLFLLVNLSKVGRISREARAQSAQGSQDLAICGIAIVGASAHVRIIAGLVGRAVEMMQRGKNAQTRFFNTEAEGRQWIDQRRQALVAR
jgi:hypothetical protein